MNSNSIIRIVCKVTLHKGELHGLRHPVKSGARPSFGFGGNLVACEISVDNIDYLPLEDEFTATIVLPYGRDIGLRFVGGEVFTLNIASTLIGEGKVISEVGM